MTAATTDQTFMVTYDVEAAGTFTDGADDTSILASSGVDIISGGAGADAIFGAAGDDVLDGGAGDDRLHGGIGDDVVTGGAGNDSVYGGAGDDILSGGDGIDFLAGGAGSDILSGGTGADRFYWGADDHGNVTTPDSDSILDFQEGAGGDVLHLGDLLQGEDRNPLTDYLSVSVGDFDSDGSTDTRLSVDADGGIFFQPTLEITLEGVDLSEGGALGQQEMIDKLINNGNLDTDV